MTGRQFELSKQIADQERAKVKAEQETNDIQMRLRPNAGLIKYDAESEIPEPPIPKIVLDQALSRRKQLLQQNIESKSQKEQYVVKQNSQFLRSIKHYEEERLEQEEFYHNQEGSEQKLERKQKQQREGKYLQYITEKYEQKLRDKEEQKFRNEEEEKETLQEHKLRLEQMNTGQIPPSEKHGHQKNEEQEKETLRLEQLQKQLEEEQQNTATILDAKNARIKDYPFLQTFEYVKQKDKKQQQYILSNNTLKKIFEQTKYTPHQIIEIMKNKQIGNEYIYKQLLVQPQQTPLSKKYN